MVNLGGVFPNQWWSVPELASAVFVEPPLNGRGALAEVIPRESVSRLSQAIQGTTYCAENRARFVWAFYERLDRLGAFGPAGGRGSDVLCHRVRRIGPPVGRAPWQALHRPYDTQPRRVHHPGTTT